MQQAEDKITDRSFSSQRLGRRFISLVFIGMVGFFIWAASFELDQVTRAQGRVIPSTQNQFVQHLEGGIVQQILVAEGSAVDAGDILLRIRDQFALAELQARRADLLGLAAKRVRLISESEGMRELFEDESLSPDAAPFLQNERNLFSLRQRNLVAQKEILVEQIEQKKFEVEELFRRRTNMRKESALLTKQIKSLTHLVKVGAASQNELIEYQSDRQRLITRIDDINSQVPRIEAGLREAQTRLAELNLRFRAEADEERAATEVKIAALRAQIAALVDQESRSEIRAPVSGIVNTLFINTVGGVIKPGDDLVEIVPDDQSIIIEARLAPRDRGDVWPGQIAIIKISAYDFAIHGGLEGEVLDISADSLQDEKGKPYFRVRLGAEAAKLHANFSVMPGMTADVDILTGRHTILSYILRPVNRVRERALRE